MASYIVTFGCAPLVAAIEVSDASGIEEALSIAISNAGPDAYTFSREAENYAEQSGKANVINWEVVSIRPTAA